MSKVMRSVKNVTKGYSSAQVKVREATSNDPWGPTGTQMSEIAQMTYNTSTEFYEIMDMIDKRLNDKGKNWRHVLKALKVLDYCLHEGSELVVTWARQSIYIIKTLREFQYVDEDGRDVGQNVRVAAKELTSLILDEERLRAERSDRRSWKSRVTGLEEFAPQHAEPVNHGTRRQQPRRQMNEEEDAEYRLALEASKYQEEEDRKKRESRQNGPDDDDDLAKAIKLSEEEEERRRRELENSNAASLFDDDPTPQQQTSQPQYTGFNQGYQQGNPVDFFANPIEQNQPQPTGYMNNAYTGFQQTQPTGFQPNYNTGFNGQQTGMGFDPYGQQQQQNHFPQSQPSFAAPQKEMNEHETRLNTLLASGDGMDTFGNTGNLRIPAQHTAPGTFVNSAGAGVARINAEATGNNPFLRQQFTGMPTVNYGAQMPAATGPAGMNGQTNNPFAHQQAPQQQQQNHDLIQF
ncbi:hypothetical protein RAB80_010943 [Fusarium oxysporum f. sp. vasinfectum]|nr:hypothetical protein RAB80_010943 [Fusarium oxysporum f. sp. vasinfectum]KAK2929815.1 hypothetical protein FoTM2_010155 [Fusarium oxysporum f. sp. vasinfectum]